MDETHAMPVAGHEPEVPVDAPEAASQPRSRRRLASAFLAWTVAAAAAGAAGGWELFNRTVTREVAPVEVTLVEDDPSTDDAPIEVSVMPDVFGLTEAEARQTLGDAGVAPGEITIVEAPYAGDAGRIVGQEPTSGSENPTAAELTVSSPAQVPDIVGSAGEEAAGALESLGATVRQIPTYQAGATPGTVLAVEPAVGETLPEQAVLRVAAEPGELYLEFAPYVTNDCAFDSTASVAGRSSEHGFSCDSTDFDDHTVIYELPAGVQRFTAAVGVADESEPGRDATVEVTASAGSCTGATAAPGATAEISCDFTGASTLTLRVPQAPDSVEDVRVVFLDPRLFGDPAVLDAIIEE